MSYIRLTEERRYFPGESNLYVYPTADSEKNVISFNGDLNGTVEAEDLFELVIRILEKTDIEEDSLWDAEVALRQYREQEEQKIENLTEIDDD